MSVPYWILDTGALLAYARGVEEVGRELVDVADVEGTVVVPLLCLIEAYAQLDQAGHELLRMLRRNPVVRTVPPEIDPDVTDDPPLIGEMARPSGRLGAGHAAFLALLHRAGVITSRPEEIRAVLGDDWTVLAV